MSDSALLDAWAHVPTEELERLIDRAERLGLEIGSVQDTRLRVLGLRRGDGLPPPTRDQRQARAFSWAMAAFGEAHVTNLHQRGLRMLEEAVELYQACGGGREKAHELVDFIFERPVGDIPQEIGGVSLTLIVLAHAAGLSADAEETRELQRVLAKPLTHFKARNEAKNAAGFNVTAEGARG